MAKFIQRFTAILPGLGSVVSLSIPTDAAEGGLRVYDKYEPPAPPPLPTITIVVIANNPPPADQTFLTRNFMLVSDIDPLPDNFVKWVATVPFGPEKQTANIIEVS